jgi:hypothetical protein
MKVANEFTIKDTSGKVLILQNIEKGISYLDFGMTGLPRTFEGYRVKYTDRTAELQADGTFKVTGATQPFWRT